MSEIDSRPHRMPRRSRDPQHAVGDVVVVDGIPLTITAIEGDRYVGTVPQTVKWDIAMTDEAAS